jgi:hypothetical protein
MRYITLNSMDRVRRFAEKIDRREPMLDNGICFALESYF